MNLCAFQPFARGTYGPSLSALGVGSSTPSHSSAFSLDTCYTFTTGGCLPPPTVGIMLLEVTFFFIGTNSTFLKKYMYFIFDISLFIKLRTSPLLESYLAMKFLFHHLHLSHIPASLPNLWFSVLNTKRSSVGL